MFKRQPHFPAQRSLGKEGCRAEGKPGKRQVRGTGIWQPDPKAGDEEMGRMIGDIDRDLAEVTEDGE